MAAHTRSLLLLRSRGAVVVHCSVVDKGRKAWLGGKSSPSPSQLLDGAPPARCSRELRPHLPLMPYPPVIYLEEWIGWKIHIIAIWRVPKNNFFCHQPCTYPPSSPLGPLRFCTGKKKSKLVAAHTRPLLLQRSRGAVVVHRSVVEKGRKAWLGGKLSPSPSHLPDGAPPARCSRELRPHARTSRQRTPLAPELSRQGPPSDLRGEVGRGRRGGERAGEWLPCPALEISTA